MKPRLSHGRFFFVCCFVFFVFRIPGYGRDILNAYNFDKYTIQTAHFDVHYHTGLQRYAKRVATILERLYEVYKNEYNIVIPHKTEALVVNDERGNGGAIDVTNQIIISVNPIKFNLRGTHDWLENVVTHEYAHIVSIYTSHKFSHNVPMLEFGFFDHPNERMALEALHVYPISVLPPWFFEGIAQYEATRYGTEEFDTHRDMILRTLALSDSLLSWPHMNVFTGRGDAYEKTYNHGFSMVRYIAKTYGDDALVSMLRESARIGVTDFDACIKAVLGIPARQLYNEWKSHLTGEYRDRVQEIGTQVYGEKINEKGYDNYYPRFSPNDSTIFYIGNGGADYSYRRFYSYALVDSADTAADSSEKSERITMRSAGINGIYSIHDNSGTIAYTAAKSKKSKLAPDKGAMTTYDVFIDSIPAEKKGFHPFRGSDERQITEKKWLHVAAFSPDGDRLACAKHVTAMYELWIIDTTGKRLRRFPTTDSLTNDIERIFSIDWSPDGRHIAVDFIDTLSRKIGIYDTVTGTMEVLCNTAYDERDPRFNADGTSLYFSSDRSGIFNIYRYTFGADSIERLTNVSGGAFSPDISHDETRMVYVNYDPQGFGIYYIDSLSVVEKTALDSPKVELKTFCCKPGYDTTLSIAAPRPYRPYPTKALFMPVLLGEEVVTKNNDRYKGQTSWKIGFAFNLFDPFLVSGLKTGVSLNGMFLLRPDKIHAFINPDHGFINPLSEYYTSINARFDIFPIPVILDYIQRAVAGKDVFFNEREGRSQELPYTITPKLARIILPFYWSRGGFSGGMASISGLYLFGSYSRQDATLYLDPYTFGYNIIKGFRLGGYAASMQKVPERAMDIAPRGLYAKLLYNFESQSLVDDEKAFNPDGSQNYDVYMYHYLRGNLKLGASSFLSEDHVIIADVGAAGVDLWRTRGTDEQRFPYYYEPALWKHPGYAYFERDTAEIDIEMANVDTVDSIPYTSGVVSGNAVAHAECSYLFPVVKEIDSKLGFLYANKIYGAFHYAAGAGWPSISRMREFRVEDFLHSVGGELRFQGQTFYRYPLAVSLRWDYGLSREEPVGGHRFGLHVGFGFDDWWLIEEPDYFARNGLVR